MCGRGLGAFGTPCGAIGAVTRPSPAPRQPSSGELAGACSHADMADADRRHRAGVRARASGSRASPGEKEGSHRPPLFSQPGHGRGDVSEGVRARGFLATTAASRASGKRGGHLREGPRFTTSPSRDEISANALAPYRYLEYLTRLHQQTRHPKDDRYYSPWVTNRFACP